MKKHLSSALTAAIAATTVFGLSGVAHAFSFGTEGIKFDEDTTVKFTFVESHGGYAAALKIFKADDLENSVAKLFWETKGSDNYGNDEYKGTFGNAVTSSSGSKTVDFTFKGGVSYTLGLESKLDSTVISTIFSTTSLNDGSQGAVFGSSLPLDTSSTNAFSNPASFSSGNPFAGVVKIAFDDGGGAGKNDKDFQDFIVKAEVPEPMTMGGLALAGAGLAFARNRRQRKSAN